VRQKKLKKIGANLISDLSRKMIGTKLKVEEKGRKLKEKERER